MSLEESFLEDVLAHPLLCCIALLCEPQVVPRVTTPDRGRLRTRLELHQCKLTNGFEHHVPGHSACIFLNAKQALVHK